MLGMTTFFLVFLRMKTTNNYNTGDEQKQSFKVLMAICSGSCEKYTSIIPTLRLDLDILGYFVPS